MNAPSKIRHNSDLFEQVVKACTYILKHDPIAKEAREYINSRLSQEDQDKYELGFFPPDTNINDITSIISDKTVLEKLLLVYPRPISGGFRLHAQLDKHNLIMPFRDVHGRIVSLLGRTLSTEKTIQKYKYTLGAHKEMFVFGLDKAKQSIIDKNYVICVEGQFDCITCQSMGVNNTVALGWANCSRYQFFQLRRYTNNLVLLLDNDDAGEKARKKIISRYGAYCNIISIKPPSDFKDIDEFLRKAESGRVQNVIESMNAIYK